MREQVIEIRQFMLLYMKQLVISSSGTQEEELQAILNYLHTTDEVNHSIRFCSMFSFFFFFELDRLF